MICHSCFQDSEKNCIRMVPIFSSLTIDEMIEVASITSAKEYEKGQFIYNQGDIGNDLYVIHKGRVKISRISSNGKEQVIRIVGPGEFLGELTLFSSMPLTENAEVMENTNLCLIEGKRLKDLMKKYPTIAFKLLEELSKRLEVAENLIEDINLHSAETRLAQGLLKMKDSNDEVVLNMTKGDLASQLGMSQETLSRRLSLFEEQGLIEQIGNKKILILDIDKLEEISY
ncbi:MAG: Crp/Fnr family transcriptional regulator [Tissierellia bacterium]|jgi:CRP-like cAMP-binding protein|nr:Crp/Fnr family transcriptional regulator [Tissierellia bacterium]